MDNLGYEQLLLLRILRDTPDIEGTEAAKRADCSWDEMSKLSHMGFIDLGSERLAPKQLHPVITDAGLEILKQAKVHEIL